MTRRRVLLIAVGAVVCVRAGVLIAWNVLKDWTMPDEAFIGCWTNETIEEL